LGAIDGDIEVARLVADAEKGSSFPYVAAIQEEAAVSSVHIPPVAVVVRLPVLEWGDFPPTYEI